MLLQATRELAEANQLMHSGGFAVEEGREQKSAICEVGGGGGSSRALQPSQIEAMDQG